MAVSNIIFQLIHQYRAPLIFFLKKSEISLAKLSIMFEFIVENFFMINLYNPPEENKASLATMETKILCALNKN
jgi:hypothetical protein